ncbi:hypothetical protein OAV21_01795 [bacterium]|nr:hypothetical protein [bacterium]
MRRIMTLIVLLTLGGCASRPKSQPIANEGRKKPMVKAEYLKAFDTRRVRNPEFVKSYYLGRRPSRNGARMHEAHRVYQVEKSNRWNLLRNNPPLRSTGPVRMIADSAFRPLPESNQLRAEENRQAAITEELRSARDESTTQLGLLKAKLEAEGLQMETLEKLRNELIRERRARATLERQVQLNQATSDDKSANSASSAEALRQWGQEQP